MASWSDFLSALSSLPEASANVTLVGPLHDKPHRPDGPTIYVDGGARWRAPGDGPSISVGDGDSSPFDLDHLLPVAKDQSDLGYVLGQIPKSVSRLSLLGFLGGRRDHEWSNLGEVHLFLKGRAPGTRVDFCGLCTERVTAFSAGPLTLVVHGLFSVFVLEEGFVTITGDCRYKVERETAMSPFSSRGLSNEGDGSVSFTSRVPYFVVRP